MTSCCLRDEGEYLVPVHVAVYVRDNLRSLLEYWKGKTKQLNEFTMPLWSVEEWRVRIASSYSALGVWRPIKLQGYGGRIKSKRFVSSYPDRRYLSSFVETCWQKMSSAAFMFLLFLVVDLSNMISVSYLWSWAGRMVCLFTEMNYLTIPSLKCVLLASSYCKASLLHIGSIVATHDYGQVGSGRLLLTPSRFASADVVSEMETGDSDDLVSMAFVLVVMATLLLKSGNVEQNPGPVVVIDDGAAVLQYLSEMDRDKIKMLGVEVGLNMVKVNNMQNLPWDMVIAWLGKQDRVIEKCGGQLTWEVLAQALQRIGETGIANDILRDKCDTSGSPLALNSERQPVLQDPIQRYAMYLRGVYKSALVSSDKFPNLSCNEFINLALVKGDQVSRSEADEFTMATLHGHVDEILGKKESIKLEEVLEPVQGQRYMKCVYMYGAPGVGKSTCVGELCRRWDEIEALKRYSLVILLRLREKRVQVAKNIEDLCYHDNKQVQQTVAAKIGACEGKDVLFVLDGFDELPASLQKHSIFVKLIQGTFLSHCTVLVTSRPSATADLYRVRPRILKQVEVIGFTQPHIEQYAKAFFASQPDVLADFLTYISIHPAIRGLMYIPLNCAITAGIYRHNRTVNRPIPQTMTQLYTEMSLTLLQRHLGEEDPLAEQLSERLEDLPPQLLKPFSSLAELAFEGLLENEVIFHNLPSSFVHFGLMNSPTELYLGRKASISHSFLHLTLQEFLAAFHISQLPPSHQKKMFAEKQYDWDVVWRFVAGLSGFSGIGWKVIQSSRGRDMDGKVKPFLLQCLYEAQVRADCNPCVVLGNSDINYSGAQLTLFDCFTIFFWVTNSKCIWKLDLKYNKFLGGTLVEMLKHWISCSSNSTSSKKYYANICSLNLSMCDLNSAAFNILADITPLMTNLAELNISHNPAGDGGLVKLLHSLSHLKHLQTLRMEYTLINCADIELLSCLISPTSSLKNLAIGNKGISSEITELMLKTVLSPSSLENVCICAVSMKLSGRATTLLEQNNNLDALTMLEPSSEFVESVCMALCKNFHLTVLNNGMHSALVGDALLSLMVMVRTNQTLKTLFMFFSQEQLLTLNNALQFNHTLKTIETSKNPNFNLDLVSTLDPRITFC